MLATQDPPPRLPAPGDVVLLSAPASAEYARHPFRLLVTADPLPSSLDAAEGRDAATALWVLLTGWQLDDHGRRLLLRTDLPARRTALDPVPESEYPGTGARWP